MTRQSISKVLAILAAVLALGFAGTWLSLGANTGWTKTSVPVVTVDEITGIESQTWKEQFVPGLEFLGGGLFAAAVLAGASRFLRKKLKPKT